ncbi:MAG: hypothetical protein K0R34_1693 [Herbinix sp.]|jgi:hypothetical protein|nr:hypothetical protein [Herbinix sp.]
MSDCRRGYVPTDEKEFGSESQVILRKAQKDILYLLEQGYKVKSASTFVGNHYMLSERQRLAIVRATATADILTLRAGKRLSRNQAGKTMFIDGLNVIITLEVALSNSTLIHCMDGTIRDLAGLRGTYRLIDKTEEAIRFIGEELMELEVEEVIFYLDAPVSNTGRLKQKLLELLKDYPYSVTVELVDNPDVILSHRGNVISQDSIILNECESWFNMVPEIINKYIPEAKFVELR